MGMQAEHGIDRVTGTLPGIYALLLELSYEEPRLAKHLAVKLKETVDLYQDLLQRLITDMEKRSGRTSTRVSRPAVREIESQIENLGELAAYSRKRALLRKQSILKFLSDSSPEPSAGSAIAESILNQKLADNAATVTTHISRMKSEGLVRALASGVFALTDAGRAELTSMPAFSTRRALGPSQYELADMLGVERALLRR